MHSAKLLTQGRLTDELRMAPALKDEWSQDFQPLGFYAIRHTTRLVPTYPIGLPLHLAVTGVLFGWHWGPYVVGIGGALATLVLSYLLALELGLPRTLALLVAGSLAPCAAFIFGSIQPLSDTLATGWCLAAVLAAIKARRGTPAWAVACGLAFSMAVLIRPTAALLLPALVIFLSDWKLVCITGIAGVPAAIALGLYQDYLYGSPLHSGYGDVSTLFAVAHFWPAIWRYPLWLGCVLPLGMVGLMASGFIVWQRQRRERVALMVLIGTFVIFHAFYVYSHLDWSYLRLIGPALPAMLMLGAMALDEFTARIPVTRRDTVVRTMTLALIVVAIVSNAVFGLPNARKHDRMYVQAREWSQKNLPPDAVVVTSLFSGVIYFQTGHSIFRWDIIPANEGAKYLAALHRAGQPVFAVLHRDELADPRMERIPGKWEKLADFPNASAWRIRPAETPPPQAPE